ncbi:glucose/arabinose dehydrogenase [Dinghuibacter silviterrae]|uniref:Glucose/arabinose dehydrogenase n=2 Tax=Dinghuibacter silviterrae TaxID=1539049 RepID=A0A4V3GKK3_9BACT|nr:glucose/arabinose dehydrogenase [Dinghuibacter silviterrae]
MVPNRCIRMALLALTLLGINSLQAGNGTPPAKKTAKPKPVPADVVLKLPTGFHAAVFAEGLGQPRHIVVTKQGDVYVKLNRVKNGKGILRLRDTNGDGKADDITGFGDYGGTGIAIKNGYLYASSDEEIFRYKLDDKGQVIDPDHPERIVTGLLNRHEHESKSIILDDAGNLYTNVGAYSNICQVEDRAKGSPGQRPCPILDSAGGIWQFKADQTDQTYGTGVRYATGLRNVVGLDWNNTTNSLFVMMHGRDQLHELFPDLYTQEMGNELPAETMYELHKGSNCGWPYIYYDQIQHKKILCPEYGGDGKKTAGEDAQDPIIAFPGHMAPNGLLFYTGNQFPARYKNGAFVAFHGSWNRQPQEKGYFVVFVPFKNGKPTGKWEVFADNFAGTTDITSPGKAAHRPCGLAQGPDGSLYVTDDAHGTIFKISYTGQ